MLVLLATLFAGVSAFAQVTTSGLTGYVADEDGEPLVGAAVIAVHTPSGTQYSAVSNEEGRYIITGMRSGGPYSVEISYIGMADIEYKDVTLTLGESYELDAEMKVSNELDAVVLVAESAFDSHKTGAGTNFTLGAIRNTPTVERSVYDIVQYNPQAMPRKKGGISFAGTNNRYNSFQVDGAMANDAFGLSDQGYNGGQAGVTPISLDALEAIQVVVAPFDVRQSGFTGGAINSVTKSGTNTITGSAYTYFNNQDFIGSTPGKLTEGEKREKYAQQTSQIYGFTIGAPVIKDKLFIFASAEYNRNSTPNVYTPANNSYEGKTLGKEVTYNGQSLGSVFNTAIANAMISHYEKEYGISNTGESYTQHQVTDQSINAMLRLDWNIRDNHKFMFRYQILDGYSDKYSSSSNQYVFNNSSYKQSNQTHTLVAELNSRISDMVSNEFRATATLVRDKRSVPYKGANIYIRDAITVTLGTEYNSGANEVQSDVYTIADNVSIFKGNHNITVGTHNEFFRFYNVFIAGAYGSYGFNTVQDFLNNNFGNGGGYQYGYQYADPNLTGGETIWGGTARAAQFGFYAQDEWKPNTRFTLTYGLRLDIPTMLNKPTENPDFNASEIAKVNGQYVGTVPKASVLFSPRIGFRWYMDKAKKSLLRGGAGIFTGRVPFVWITNAFNNTGMEYKTVSVTDSDQLGALPPTSDPYKDIVTSGTYEFINPGSSNTLNTVSENFKYPQTFRLNLGYEQYFGYGWKFTFDALYSKSFNNVFFQNLSVRESDKLTYAVSAAAANGENVMPRYEYIDPDSPYTTVIGLTNTNKGYSYSLSGQIEKSFDFGLDLMAAYTFGHSFSANDGVNSIATSSYSYNYAVNPGEPELAHSLFDRPHKVMAVVSYTTPKYAAGRLQTSISVTYNGTSGQRFSYVLHDGSAEIGGDGTKYNSPMYIPTADEISQMTWTDPDGNDAQKLEQFISGDKYLSKHRGEWAERNGAISDFENHFDVHIAQDFYYDRKSGRKIQFVVDFMNIGNLFNREWGRFGYEEFYYRQLLRVNSLADDGAGNKTPSYSFVEPTDYPLNDFYSRWRCQIGLRVTF